jgi:hypothetical protein
VKNEKPVSENEALNVCLIAHVCGRAGGTRADVPPPDRNLRRPQLQEIAQFVYGRSFNFVLLKLLKKVLCTAN